MRLLTLLFAGLLFAAPSAFAVDLGQVYSSCSGRTAAAGSTQPIPFDTNGNPCPPTVNNGVPLYTSATLESGHILKATAGNLYSLQVTTTTVSGYLMVFNSATIPPDGPVTPALCTQINQTTTGGFSVRGPVPAAFSTGIVAVFSSTGCYTKTGSATATFQAMVQ